MLRLRDGQNDSPGFHLGQFIPSISKTIRHGTTFYVIEGPYSTFNDHLGQHIRFPQCPHLTFASMERAFEYFEALANLLKLQRALQAVGQPAGYAPQQAPLPERPDFCERTWQLKSSLESSNVKAVVHLPTNSCEQMRGPYPDSGWESVSRDSRKAPAMQPSLQSSPSQVPPQTLFAESTPHAQEIQARPRVVLPVREVQSWPYNSQVTTGFDLQKPRPSPSCSKVSSTLSENHTAPNIYRSMSSLSTSSLSDEILAQPQSSSISCPLPLSYTTSVFPKTLAKKDKRVLGVSLTASIDEYVPVCCSRAGSMTNPHSVGI